MRFLLIFIFILFATPLQARPSVENALTVHVTKEVLVHVLEKIAQSITQIKDEFPQLKHWDEAEIFPDRIEYHHPDCDLSIVSKSSTDAVELRVGVYLKMKAFGKKAPLLKQTLLNIIAKHFEKIRDLRHRA